MHFTPAARSNSALYSAKSTEIVSNGRSTVPWVALVGHVPFSGVGMLGIFGICHVRHDSSSATRICDVFFRTWVGMQGDPLTIHGRGMRTKPAVFGLSGITEDYS